MKHRDIFEIYAHEYDLITNAAARTKYHQKEIQALIEKFQPESVLDAGCATGLSASLFAKQGIKTVGLDRSRRMLTEARKKYGHSGYPLSFKSGQFEKLPANLNGKFDLVVCLANAISGVGSFSALKKSLGSFKRVLRPGGTLVLQMLNYASIKDGELFPVKATRNKQIGYIRYARRSGRQMEIHVVRLNLARGGLQFEPFCHRFDNFSPAEISRATREVGFGNLRRWSNLFVNEKFSNTCRDLVLTAVRQTSLD